MRPKKDEPRAMLRRNLENSWVFLHRPFLSMAGRGFVGAALLSESRAGGRARWLVLCTAVRDGLSCWSSCCVRERIACSAAKWKRGREKGHDADGFARTSEVGVKYGFAPVPVPATLVVFIMPVSGHGGSRIRVGGVAFGKQGERASRLVLCTAVLDGLSAGAAAAFSSGSLARLRRRREGGRKGMMAMASHVPAREFFEF
ncbi:hypothetical protein AXG93_3612s1080 [Marchantia polymorpha subsp. ruderalis]|uniref:Uncharacterized protein n=1 Tax=Marchantia polymorpha subsp. ruderalis TaxID=1480154 RepID=A0A176WDP7_MARPO|nr:hypothetical protein AXG93_3612s1080 [Marchantia polymorpha subsp. ruderalis]